jgi:hypothetical protein
MFAISWLTGTATNSSVTVEAIHRNQLEMQNMKKGQITYIFFEHDVCGMFL